jgi:osmoprotectant transport system ATP-binding protein
MQSERPTAPADPVFEVRGVSKTYGGAPVLGPLDLRIDRGTTVLIGPSGCGKSTLLRLLIGLIVPETGSVVFEGASVDRRDILALRRRMGYVIQDGGLFPHLSGRGNVSLVPRCLRWPAARLRQRIEALVDLVRLPTACLDLLPHQMSGGQRQRVALMRALMLDPDVLLLDEPLAALDPMVRRDLQGDLRRVIRAVNKTVVLVTHDIGEAVFFGDTLVLLRSGQIVQRGTWDEFLNAPSEPFVGQFISAQRTAVDVEAAP